MPGLLSGRHARGFRAMLLPCCTHLYPFQDQRMASRTCSCRTAASVAQPSSSPAQHRHRPLSMAKVHACLLMVSGFGAFMRQPQALAFVEAALPHSSQLANNSMF